MSTEENLKKKRRTRGGHRAFATKLVKESEGLLQQLETATGAEKVEIADELLTNQDVLKARLEDLKLIDNEIADLIVDDTEAEKDMVDAGDNNRAISKILVRIRKSGEQPRADTSDRKPTMSHAKLPKLNLPTFDGDPLQFQGFWDIFTS